MSTRVNEPQGQAQTANIPIYRIPKATQYTIGGEVYFELGLPADTTLPMVMTTTGPVHARVLLRDLQLNTKALKKCPTERLKTIVEHYLNIKLKKATKSQLIDIILKSMEYE
jgi:hypothetical protein